ncbi:MAG: methylmalonyl-CoA mutase, partial [Ignavibacteriales bacterium]|nr:methylmalonyl-CoA mutase [Ignavibacteriales bacterium]
MDSDRGTRVELPKEPTLRADFPPSDYDEWKEKAIADLKGAPFEKKLITKTYEGIDVKPLYTRRDVENLPHMGAKPGEIPFARGFKADGYLGEKWLVAQEIPYADPAELNRALKNDLERGQTAIVVSFDRAARFAGETGEGTGEDGTSIRSLRCLEIALADLPIEKTPVYLHAGAAFLPALAALKALAERRGVSFADIRGGVLADPYSFALVEGRYPGSIDGALDDMAAAITFLEKKRSPLKAVGVSVAPYHRAGASVTEELGCFAAHAADYTRRLAERGVDPASTLARTRITFELGANYFMELAKLRAARMIRSEIARAFDAVPAAAKAEIHAQTSRFNQTLRDPYVNMLRATTEAFSAIAGGVESLAVAPFDERFGPPSEFSRRVARNAQVVLAEEAHLERVVDPAGGSYYVEALTAELAEKGWALFQEIEREGGALEAIGKGTLQERCDATYAKREKDFNKRKSVLVGVNMYADPTEKPLAREERNELTFVETLREEFAERRKSREIDDAALDETRKARENRVEKFADALVKDAFFDELVETAEEKRVPPLRSRRLAEPFESLRDAADEYAERTGARPKAFLSTMGPVKQHKARADFARGFFEPGGFEVVYPNGFETTDAAADAFVRSGADVAVLCSTDETYPE